MPCNSDHLRRDSLETESSLVMSLLKETGSDLQGRKVTYYGDVKNLSNDTAALCQWCKENTDKVKDMSLELQMWWRDHQKADQEREQREIEEMNRQKVREDAIAKLTDEEKRVLGVS